MQVVPRASPGVIKKTKGSRQTTLPMEWRHQWLALFGGAGAKVDEVKRTTGTIRREDLSKIGLLGCGGFGFSRFDKTSSETCWIKVSTDDVFRMRMQDSALADAFVLEHLLERSIIYRDLKPDNLLLTVEGFLKMTDMGLAKFCIGKTYTTCGTPDYFAPELIESIGHSHSLDWWTWSVLIVELMCGHTPFEAPTMPSDVALQGGHAPICWLSGR